MLKKPHVQIRSNNYESEGGSRLRCPANVVCSHHYPPSRLGPKQPNPNSARSRCRIFQCQPEHVKVQQLYPTADCSYSSLIQFSCLSNISILHWRKCANLYGYVFYILNTQFLVYVYFGSEGTDYVTASASV